MNTGFQKKYRFKFDKLVRDKIPHILEAQSIQVISLPLNPEETQIKLLQKLDEEINELKQAKNYNELLEEMADVFTVLLALGKKQGITQEQLIKAYTEKQDAKGTFDTLCYIKAIEIPTHSPALSYYLERPGQYQEITQSEPEPEAEIQE